MVRGRVGSEHAAHSGVESASEDGREAGFLEALAVGPLPGVFEVRFVARFVVGRVKVVDAAAQACFHDGEVLVGERHVDYHFGLVAFEKGYNLLHVVGVDGVAADVGCPCGFGHGFAFGEGA